jgi:hypothetical protein
MNTHSVTIDMRGPFSRNSAAVQMRAISCLQRAYIPKLRQLSKFHRTRGLSRHEYKSRNKSRVNVSETVCDSSQAHTGSDAGTTLYYSGDQDFPFS